MLPVLPLFRNYIYICSSFVYDNSGNVIAQTDSYGNTQGTTYDSLNRPVGQSDALGNSTSVQLNAMGQPTLSKDANGDGTTNVYDNATGNLLQSQDPTGSQSSMTYAPVIKTGDGMAVGGLVASSTQQAPGVTYPTTTSYSWDAENRLIGLTSLASAPSGSQLQLSFVYDYKGRRIQKLVSTNSGTGYVGEYTNNFVYDGWNCLATLTPSLSLQNSYMWGSDLSGSMRGAGGIGGLLQVSSYGTSTTNCFVAYDGTGNVSALVNSANGVTLANYDYGPFGESIRATGPMAANNWMRFSTKFTDNETDFLNFGYRYLNPSLGRWANRDPIGEAGGVNLHGFVGNNPINYSDLNGLTIFVSTHPIAPGQFGYGPYTYQLGAGDDLQFTEITYLDPEFYGGGGMESQDGILLVVVAPIADPLGMYLGKLLSPIAKPIGDFLGFGKPKLPNVGATKCRIGLPVPKDLPTTLSPRQALHTPGPTFVPGKSPVTADAQKLLDGIHSGEYPIIRMNPRGQPVVDFGDEIGTHAGTGQPTQYGTVHSGKQGAHIVPANPVQH